MYYKPNSKKGEIRKQIAQMIMDGVEKGKITVQIVRTVDFYSPEASLNMVIVKVFEDETKGKKPGFSSAINLNTHVPIHPTLAKRQHCLEIPNARIIKYGTYQRI